MARQVAEFSIEDQRRHDSGRLSLEGIGADLGRTYAASAKELREALAVHLATMQGQVAQIGERIAEESAQLHGMDQRLAAALHEGSEKHDTLNSSVETQLVGLRGAKPRSK